MTCIRATGCNGLRNIAKSRMRGLVLAASGGTALLVTLVLLHATAHSGSQRTALMSPGEFPTSPLVEYIKVPHRKPHITQAASQACLLVCLSTHLICRVSF